MDADWIITEINKHLWGSSKSETSFNSVDLSLPVIEICVNLVSEPV